MNDQRFISHAQWPEGVIRQKRANDHTIDVHATEEACRAVCRMLERDGLGGEGKIFPLKTWIEDTLDPEDTKKGECTMQCEKCGWLKEQCVCDEETDATSDSNQSSGSLPADVTEALKWFANNWVCDHDWPDGKHHEEFCGRSNLCRRCMAKKLLEENVTHDFLGS
jgi:hypothetical protein